MANDIQNNDPFYVIENPDHAVTLRQYAEPVSFPLSEADRSIIDALCAAADTVEGVGLAAPQIGYSRQIVIIEIDDAASQLRGTSPVYPRQVYVNPSYEPVLHSSKSSDWEGCFSVNSIVGKVSRFDKIHFKYQDIDGTWHDELVEGFYARVVQHEIDHLRGTLIVDRLTKDTLHGSKEEMKKARMAELTPEQRAIYNQLSTQISSKEK